MKKEVIDALLVVVVKEKAHEQTADIDSKGMIDVVVLLHQQKKSTSLECLK